jgi:hypothetical protein
MKRPILRFLHEHSDWPEITLSRSFRSKYQASDFHRPQRSVSSVVTLPEASNDTLVLVKACLHGVRKSWRDGYRYSKAGVVTTDLVPLSASQRAFPGLGQLDREHGAALMGALDACNRRFGRGAVVPGSAGFAPKREWSTKFDMRSPRYTTRIDELPTMATWTEYLLNAVGLPTVVAIPRPAPSDLLDTQAG